LSNTSLVYSHYTIEDFDSSLRVNICTPRPKIQIIPAVVVLLVWVFFGVTVGIPWLFGWLGSLPSSLSLLSLFYLAWLVFFAYAGIHIGYRFFVIFWGQEIIEVCDQSITQHIRVFSFTRSYKYVSDKVNHFRVSPIIYDPMYQSRPKVNVALDYDHGPIVFEFDFKTIHLGSFLEEIEAKEIVAIIEKRFPQYNESA